MALIRGSAQQNAFWCETHIGTSHILLEARAGTGKSFSCKNALSRLPAGLEATYVAFNKHIADEFRKGLPGNAKSATLHSVGLAALRKDRRIGEPDGRKVYKLIEQSSCPKPGMAALSDLISIVKNGLHDAATFNDPPTMVALGKKQGIQWGKNVDPEIVASYVPEIIDGCRRQAAQGIIDFDDMIWIPAYENLTLPGADLLFVDEAQDLNRCQTKLADLMTGDTGRQIIVGDRYQCQPAGTMVTMTGGSHKPIEQVQAGDQVASFDRRGSAIVGRARKGQRVLATQNRDYSGRMIKVRAELRQTECTPEHKWVCRFAERSTGIYVTYLMRKGDWFRVGWCQLFNKHGNTHLSQRARIEQADGAWILGVHTNRTDASVQENIVAARYGLPLLPFHQVPNATHITQEAITKTFTALEDVMKSRAQLCLTDFGRMIEHPFYKPNDSERQGRSTIFETQACNLIDGLYEIPIYTGEKSPTWWPVKVSSYETKCVVYSLKVEKTETYIADGLVTHNSIYGFRGADAASIPNLQKKLAANGRGLVTLPLTVTRRCPAAVVDLAQMIVGDIEAMPGAPEGTVNQIEAEEVSAYAQVGDMVLSRTNAPLVKLAFEFIDRGTPVYIRGRDMSAGITALAKKIGGNTPEDLITRTKEYRETELTRLRISDASAEALTQLDDKCSIIIAVASQCDFVDQLGTKLKRLFQDDGVGVCLSSIHRSKGLEAKRVIILSADIPHRAARLPWEKAQERNLAYVAVTRCQEELTFAGGIPPYFESETELCFATGATV